MSVRGSAEYKSFYYGVWTTMKNRCCNKNRHGYSDYGGRGIYVCERWRTSAKNFMEDMGPRPDGYVLDRIDNDGPYSPENCRWVSRTENIGNRRNTVRVKFNDKLVTLAEAARQLGMKRMDLYYARRVRKPIAGVEYV